jgi:CheY-like chemotaxis protein/HPt (histidine-containing phosphotransfer) domain-containing protein
MPEMDGFAVAERIKMHPEWVRAAIMMLTSGPQPGDTARCRQLGLATFLTKPVRQAELWKAIQTALGSAAPAVPPPQRAAAPRPAEVRRLRILLAEDNVVNQKLATRLLEQQGHAVVVASDGRAALDAVERQEFDLILMDGQMPEMDGFEAATAIRAREKDTGGRRIPIVALTAYAMKGDRERCLAAGMDDYLAKPFRAKELVQVIERLLPAGPANPGPAQAVPATEDIDWTEALSYVEGNRRLLSDLIELFLGDCPDWMTELARAIAAGDAAQVKRLAHNLKGSLGTFGARSGYDAALELEMMGRANDLTGAEAAYAALQDVLQRLQPALTRFVAEHATAAPGGTSHAPHPAD